MVCQQCKERAVNFHIVQQVNGKQTEIFLCDVCAKNNPKLTFQLPVGGSNIQFNFGGVLPSFIAGIPNVIQKKVVNCQLCGMTFQDFQKTGRVGCGSCYTTFQNELIPVISRIHGNVEHRGKKREIIQNNINNQNSKIIELRKELTEAINKEEYENAAKIRDLIRDLETAKKEEDEFESNS